MSQESTQLTASRQGQRRMTTEKQRESARINGRKSRGPITVEGKLRNRLNGFKHGAYSESSLILPEDQKRFNAIFQDYIENYKPSTELELELIEQMVSSSWRRRRHAAMLHQYWNKAISDVAVLPGNDALSPTALAAKAFEKLLADRAPIHILDLAEQREGRRFGNASRNFRQEQKWREQSQNNLKPDFDLNLIP